MCKFLAAQQNFMVLSSVLSVDVHTHLCPIFSPAGIGKIPDVINYLFSQIVINLLLFFFYM